MIFFVVHPENSAHLVCNYHNNLGSLMVNNDNTVVIVVNPSKHYKTQAGGHMLIPCWKGK